MIGPNLQRTIDITAKSFGIPPALVSAIVMQETGGNPWLTRFEPGWKYFVQPALYAHSLGITEQTEKVMQAMSWGPAQIMGSVARELGFIEELTQLTDPGNSVLFSCKKISSLMVKYTDEDDVIASYNAGSPRKNPTGAYINQSYVDGVHGFLQKFRSA